MNRPVYIIDGARTPFLKARGVPGNFSAVQLAVGAAQPLLLRQPFSGAELDEVILGCVMPMPDEVNIARIVSLRLGCGDHVPAWTVQRNCGSGLQALDTAAQRIASGTAELILAGGVEAMSRAPLLYSQGMSRWLGQLNRTRGPLKKIAALAGFRPSFLKPVVSLLLGLKDPVAGLSMGRTAEIIAHRFGISREQMDAYAARSHQRLARAQQEGRLAEIEAIFDRSGRIYEQDDGVRPDSAVEGLAKLKAVFDRPHGLVTAGNSAQISDGAACLLLASEEARERYQLPALGRIVDCCWRGLDPAQMGLGPAYAIGALMQKQNLSLADVDQWEINEAFAAQVLACLAALKDDAFCRQELGRSEPLGEIDQEWLNIDGGGVSLGHPVGASGARIVLHLLRSMAAGKRQRGVASLCIGGGQGGAMLLEAA